MKLLCAMAHDHPYDIFDVAIVGEEEMLRLSFDKELVEKALKHLDSMYKVYFKLIL